MNIRSRVTLLLAIGLIGIAGDQITKSIAQSHLREGELHVFLADMLRLQLAHNYGAFLSLGDSLSPTWRQGLWSIGVACILVAILVYALLARSLDRPLMVSLALILAGGASNLYDRIAYDGYVVDFLNVGVGPLRTGIFNLADMAITTGALIVLWTTLRSSKQVKSSR
jgi:signal peptidase II